MRIRDSRFFEIVVCYQGRRYDGRSRTPAVCSHRPASLKAVLPRYRSRFSKHQFTQPQLLAILCLMRYEDWTFRETEVRLGEHRELRQTLGLLSVPDFTTLYRFLQRLEDQTIDRAVGETVRRLRRGKTARPKEDCRGAWTRQAWRRGP